MRITKQQRDQIVLAYFDGGYEAAKIAAAKIGLAPSYIKNMRHRRQLPILPIKKERLFKNEKPIDHRWKWAVARGAVVA